MDCSQHLADSVPNFLNGRSLRDYQIKSLHWMMENARKGRSCILGDEMVSTGFTWALRNAEVREITLTVTSRTSRASGLIEY